MKILIISALFPPDSLGGAEDSALNQALWLKKQGNDVHVLTTSSSQSGAGSGTDACGLNIRKVFMPRPYPTLFHSDAAAWKKPLWHAQDHLDPRNAKIVGQALDDVKPDIVLIHILQGIGYNALQEISKRDIPTVYFLHDMGLACIRMALFKNGKKCTQQCFSCKMSTAFKASLFSEFKKIGFCAPSQIHLDTIAELSPIKKFPHTSILNANKYPLPSVPLNKAETPHFIYVGRLEPAKGISVLLDAAHRVSDQTSILLTVIGNGRDEAKLREKYGHENWCRFTGRLTQQEIANHMAHADALCVPSVSWENSPGVAIHALLAGVPVLGSNTGGIPELVQDGKNGMLVPPGDVDAWTKALLYVIENQDAVSKWRDYAKIHAHEFDQDYIGQQVLAFIQRVMSQD